MFNQRFAGQRKSLLIGGIAGAMLLSITVVFAQGPLPQAPQASLGTGFTYQGQLKKNSVPVNSTCSMTFSLWDSQSNLSGQVGGGQTLNPVAVTNGVFTVVLNGGNQFGAGAFAGQDRWMQTVVQRTGDVGATTLSRQQLSAAPSALFSAAPWVTSGSNLYYSAGNVGIGTNNPLALFHLKGNTASGGNNTAVFENTAIGPYASSIHYGLNGDWYIRSAAASGKVVIQDSGGNVGIGTNSPLALFHLKGSTASSGNNTAVIENTAIGPYASSIHYGPNGDWYIRSAAASGKVVIQDSGGNVGIRTSTPSQALEVNGITSLGPPGSVYGYLVTGAGLPGPNYPTLGFNSYGSS